MSTLEQKAKNNAYMKEWSRKNPEKVKTSKRKSYLKNRVAILLQHKTWSIKNKEHKARKDREYQELNKEKIALNKRQYYLKNREHLIKVNNDRTTLRRQTDVLFNLKSKLRTQIAVNLIARKYKKSKSTEDLLGAKVEVVKVHIESLFKPGMTWENHGIYGWHIDHKIPLASAKNQEDVYGLFHYENLQPLWANENLSKGSSLQE